MEYIIVQAGGKGTRLGYLTEHKPKALVPVDNLPMLFHLFRKYPDKRFIIIADYHREVMRSYLDAFADVKYQVVDAKGSGTCAGIGQALELIPEHKPFMLVWSDLILPESFRLPDEYREDNIPDEYREDNASEECRNEYRQAGVPQADYIGISQTFPCRWSYENGSFKEESSTDHGVAGLFLFTDKSKLADVPDSGELVRWMQQKHMVFWETGLAGTKEFGILEEYEKLENSKCRPFNRITVETDAAGKKILTKAPVDAQGEALAKRECAWYEKAKDLGIGILPRIYGTAPLKMEYIEGKNIYECSFGKEQKEKLLERLIDSLDALHKSETVPADSFSVKEAYFHKTFDRLARIQDLVPFGRAERITVNGRSCRNVYYHRRELEKTLDKLVENCREFAFIHGDCTFSNMMVRESGEPVLIDPRGYFGYTELYGDVRYDWAKLYYSLAGNYDMFNLKKFRLHIGRDADEGVRLNIESNGWEDMEATFFQLTGADEYEIKLLHAVIWLSLTTYAWQDYDSVCGAFYNGLYYLEEVL